MSTKVNETIDIEALKKEMESAKADAAAMVAEAKAMFEEVQKIKQSASEASSNINGISAEDLKILEGIKANEARMKEKVPLFIDSDPLNSANKYQFVGVGSDAVKIEKDKTVYVSRAIHDAAEEAKNQAKIAAKKMQAQSDEWDPEAWISGVNR